MNKKARGELLMTFEIILGIVVPFMGTTLGAAAALLCRKSVSGVLNKLLIGFAAGVMLAASIWSLIMPSVEMSEGGIVPCWVPAASGFTLGIAVLIVMDAVLPVSSGSDRKNKMLFFAVTVHNVPEGMAVGAVFAGLIAGSNITLAAAFSLSVGIALQNIPEGAIIGLPLVSAGKGKGKAFLYGVVSGAVEPIAALITIALYMVVVAVLPYLLAFAAGAMVYVAAKELIPEVKDGSAGVIGLALGFVIMMIMDLSL